MESSGSPDTSASDGSRYGQPAEGVGVNDGIAVMGVADGVTVNEVGIMGVGVIVAVISLPSRAQPMDKKMTPINAIIRAFFNISTP